MVFSGRLLCKTDLQKIAIVSSEGRVQKGLQQFQIADFVIQMLLNSNKLIICRLESENCATLSRVHREEFIYG